MRILICVGSGKDQGFQMRGVQIQEAALPLGSQLQSLALKILHICKSGVFVLQTDLVFFVGSGGLHPQLILPAKIWILASVYCGTASNSSVCTIS